MHHIMCRRKGISTILGTLIFIGILFSAIVPMVLVMNQANIIYSKQLHETENMDTEKANERVYVFLDADGDTIEVSVYNEGETPVEIVRVWINNKYEPVSHIVDYQATEMIYEHYPATDNEYYIKVSTVNGNIFSNDDNPLTRTDGNWVLPESGVDIVISNAKQGSRFHIRILVEDTQEEIFGGDDGDFGPTGEDVRTFQPLEEGKIYIVYAENKSGVGLPDSPQQVDLTVPGMKRINFDGS